jgi:hypothetical protein
MVAAETSAEVDLRFKYGGTVRRALKRAGIPLIRTNTDTAPAGARTTWQRNALTIWPVAPDLERQRRLAARIAEVLQARDLDPRYNPERWGADGITVIAPPSVTVYFDF